MKNMVLIDWVVFVLVVVGALNWGLVGFFHYDFIATVFGDMSVISRVIYGTIGISGVYMVFTTFK